MKKLGQTVYSKWDGAVNNEKGSQSVEFMGIAAVVIIVLVIVGDFMNDSGSNWITNIFEGVFSGISNLLPF